METESTLIEATIEDMPEVQDIGKLSEEQTEAIDDTLNEVMPTDAEGPLVGGPLFDSDNNAFDPSIHETDREGNPARTKAGRFRKKRGGWGKRSGSSEQGSSNVTAQQIPIDCIKAAQVATSMQQSLACNIFGDEWLYKLDESTGTHEEVYMVQSYATYFAAKNITDLPPGLALVMAIASYAAPRFAKPKTQTKLAKLVENFKNWRLLRRAKKEAKKGGK